MNAPASKELTIADRTQQFLAPIKADLPLMLPATVKPERFQAVFMTAAMKNPDILKCEPSSVRMALLNCANDGLVPDGRQAVLVKYGNICQYMPMVQGIISRAFELGETFSITAECVRKNDFFKADRSDPEKTEHSTPDLDQDRGDIIGAYAIFRDKGGRVIHREIMDRTDLEKVRNSSKSKNGPAWANWPEEMHRKSPIKRGAKYVPMSDKLRDIINRDNELSTIEAPGQPITINPLLPPPDEPASLIDRLTEAISLCTSEEELNDIQSTYDDELNEADDTVKEQARLVLNAKTLALAAAKERAEADAKFSAEITEALRAAADLEALVSVANEAKAKVSDLPKELSEPIYALFRQRRAEFEKAVKA